MKKAAKAWQKLELTERIIYRLADLYFVERDWFRLVQQDDDINIIVDELHLKNTISDYQKEVWYVKQEWVTTKKIATFKSNQPKGISPADRKSIRKLMVSIATLENKVEKIINRYKK